MQLNASLKCRAGPAAQPLGLTRRLLVPKQLLVSTTTPSQRGLPQLQSHPAVNQCRLGQTIAVASTSGASAGTAALPLPSQPQHASTPAPADVFEAFRRCRNLLSILMFFAVYAFLSSGAGSSLPFASVGLAAGETGQHGITSAAKSAWAGLAAGFLHTLAGPDHLAALTPLTIGRNRFAASALGALWGFGHSTGQLILGLFFVLLKDRFTDFLPALTQWTGPIVGLTLIAIGLIGVYESFFEKHEAGDHTEQEVESVKMAIAGGGSVPAAGQGASLRRGFATYATGIVYGLQPDALFVVIPALALPTKLAAIAYCTAFVIGTVTAMGGYTLLIGTTSQALIKEQPWLQKHLSTIAAAFAITVGTLILLSGFGFEVPFFS